MMKRSNFLGCDSRQKENYDIILRLPRNVLLLVYIEINLGSAS